MVLSTDLTSLDLYLAVVINGILTGLGVAIGTYIAQKYSIQRMDRLFKRIKKLEEDFKEKSMNHMKDIYNHKKRIKELENVVKEKSDDKIKTTNLRKEQI